MRQALLVFLAVGPTLAGGMRGQPVRAAADHTPPFRITEQREPCAAYDPLRRPFFGDLHVHTAFSFDASTQDTRNTPRDAYRFAKGAPLGIQPYDEQGHPLRSVQLDRPLDFVAVTDHAELLGEVHICMTPGTPGYGSLICRIHRGWPSLAFRLLAGRTINYRSRWGICGERGERCLAAAGGVWREIQSAAEEAYDRSSACRFTSFVAYEWTASVGKGQNLHRNVVFRNEKVPPLPVSWVETPTAVHLWDQLEEKCLKGIPGCDVLTIPHNSNLSGGLMFESARVRGPEDAGMPMSDEELRRRSRWEPLVEIMQHKGSSECRLGGPTTDEACGFEQLPYDRFGAQSAPWLVKSVPPSHSSFVRSALERGLQLQAERGLNPFRYGIIASTDTHIAAPGRTAEKGHPGHGGAGRGAGEGLPRGFPDEIEFNPGGLAVLWAEENSRDALFAAMRRREAYGTSGTRPVVRFFGGWDLPADLCASEDFVATGYRTGVPMGGDLPAPPPDSSRAPRFAAFALRDPAADAAPLQRIQIVKGWLEGGAPREKVLDVAGGPNDARVEPATCQRQGAGAARLCTVWTDPDFDPETPAFYYVRVLENPSCRWNQYVCLEAQVDCSQPERVPKDLAACCDPKVPRVIQERAWTSPIWYTP